MTKKRKPIRGADIFLSGEEEGKNPLPTPLKQSTEDIKTSRRQNIKTLKHQDVKTSRRSDVKKERVNYYIDPDLLKRLDQIQAEVRGITSKRISKSDIVNIAIEQILREFEEKKTESKLFQGLDK